MGQNIPTGSSSRQPRSSDKLPFKEVKLDPGAQRSHVIMLDTLGEGCVLLADRAYDSDAMRNTLVERGAWACVKPMPNRKRIPAFSPFLYRYLVEHFFSKLKYCHAIATCHDTRGHLEKPLAESAAE